MCLIIVNHEIDKAFAHDVRPILTEQLGGGQVDFLDNAIVIVKDEITNGGKVVQVQVMGLELHQFQMKCPAQILRSGTPGRLACPQEFMYQCYRALGQYGAWSAQVLQGLSSALAYKSLWRLWVSIRLSGHSSG